MGMGIDQTGQEDSSATIHVLCALDLLLDHRLRPDRDDGIPLDGDRAGRVLVHFLVHGEDMRIKKQDIHVLHDLSWPKCVARRAASASLCIAHLPQIEADG